ncbi:MAG: inner membrane protein YpjD [Granulosicoccus sp.]
MSFVLSLIAAAFYSVSSAMLSHTLKGRKAAATSSDGLSAANQPHHAKSTPVSSGSGRPGMSTPANSGQMHRLTLVLATVAVILHGWVVIHQTGLPHGLSLPLFTSFATMTLTIVLLHIVLCLRQPADYLGLAVYPGAAISLIVSQASGGGTPIEGDAIQIHVLLSLVAYGVLSLAAAQAVLVAIQRHYLSIHKPGGFIRALPPLDVTEKLLFTLLAVGFVMLSLALASGFAYLDDMFDQRLVHKTVLSCIGWGIFGILLFGRWQFGWRGKKAVHWTLGGFGILVLAYFGTKIVVEVVLN